MLLRGGGAGLGAERKTIQKRIFGGRHDNNILNVQILLSKNSQNDSHWGILTIALTELTLTGNVKNRV